VQKLAELLDGFDDIAKRKTSQGCTKVWHVVEIE